MNNKKCCRNCHYWWEDNDWVSGFSVQKDCRRYPPIKNVEKITGEVNCNYWPKTWDYNWCGEWKIREV